ncbi:hypothetical protein [Rhizomonospora bruguierae]|uniref:hypothetical protein n=1 Tax=Rhizomonospora bruguierae TaxID=1581705 RepID=UPI001BD078D4|nr:hypothetical protein [Micromonospora sp. NBRC 107566]
MGDQFGYAEGDQTNAGRDAYIGCTFNSRVDGEQDESESPDHGSGTAKAATGSGIGVVAVLGILGYFLFGVDEPFPTHSDPWPAGVKQEAVVAATQGWLDKCQKSGSASPANCPQSLAETSGDVSKVRWAFHGNALEAAVIRYNEADSRFDVLGTVVTVADYTVRRDSRRDVTPITYWANVHWTDGRLDVQEVKEHSSLSDPEIAKQDPKQAWETVEAKLKDAFTRCVRSANSAMPAGCPKWTPPPGATKAKWSFVGDPLLTARPSFDPKFGVLHIKGTYGLAVRYNLLGSTKSETRMTNYDAVIASTPAGPVVLEINEAA